MHSDPHTVHAGRYSDGRTAQSTRVEVRLVDRGVEIIIPGATESLIWPYGALTTPTPLSKKAADALLTYDFMPGASLFVGDQAFVGAISRLAPQLTARAYGWQSAKPWVMAAAGLAAIFAAMWAANLSPAHWIATLLPDKTRVAVGQQVIGSMVGKRRECTETRGVAALDRLTSRLVANAPSGSRFDVRVIDWNLVNAFAAPGEQIVLTRQIIAQAKSPEEIAAVLAHEMGHGIERHPETAIIRAIGWTAALELITGGGGTIANLGLGLAQLSYTRAAEREADARALALLDKAEISNRGFVDFFRRMSEAEAKSKVGEPSEWRSIFSTHPDAAERARNAASRPVKASTPALSAEDWQALRAICGPVKADGKTEAAPSEKTTPPPLPR